MSFKPFLRRKLITSVRRGTAFSERCAAASLMAAMVVGSVLVWDWWGWDRSSVLGMASFAWTTFGLLVATQAVLVLGLVSTLVAPAIAMERDRKSLDALLATEFSSADIVVGKMMAGLLRSANSLVVVVPFLVLMTFLGGVDPRLVFLAVAGLASTALAVAALAVAVSSGARTASEAASLTVAGLLTWLYLPSLIVLLLPRVWLAAASWLVPIGFSVLDGSPIAVAVNLVGLIWRGSLVDVVVRMIAYQTLAAVVLISWAIVRLRPASRAVYDLEGRAALLRVLRARWPPRPRCGDDPVLWRELHSARAISPAMMMAHRLVNVLMIGLLAYMISWFAVPAFAELSRHGYGPMTVSPSIPELNPLARVLFAKLSKLGAAPDPGQARLEFNIVLRQATLIFDVVYIFLVAGFAAEGLAKERERETWLGLIATSLTGREILRAKRLGSIWRARRLALVMMALWLVGLLVGAVHPIGFLMAIAGLVVSCWFLAALGVSVSLWSRDRNQATGRIIVPVALCVGLGLLPFMSPGPAAAVLAANMIPFQAWASLLSYEDVHAMTLSIPVPQFAAIGIQGVGGARFVLAAWLITTTAQAVGAFFLARAAARGFDAAVGRPVRSISD